MAVECAPADAESVGADPSGHWDVLIVGAGLSGIGAGWHLATRCPQHTFAILEARADLGGTWDLFRYPGIRSDSDMYTMSYGFRPWQGERGIAEGAAILEYLRETAREAGLLERILFGHRVVRAEWSSQRALWTLEVERGAAREIVRLTCRFLLMCSGYYDYERPYLPELPGMQGFRGRIVHPQFWTPDIDYAGKRVIVIGSGATAVTLVPELAKTAAHVTMLQRSPTYIIARPTRDRLARRLRGRVPARAAHAIVRWKNVLLGMFFFQLSRRRPQYVRGLILRGVQRALGPDYDVATHFTPRYAPWDQRLCLAPDGDLFAAIRQGRVSVATDRIETFTEHGVRLASGAELEADLIVTATGLNLRLLGGVRLVVDGREVDLGRTLTYKGMMYSDVPNLASVFGYTNASWTLKADLTCRYVCRLLAYMHKRAYRMCVPRRAGAVAAAAPLIDFSSGYVRRALDRMPKQGARSPWKLHQNYVLDVIALGLRPLRDGVLRFYRNP